LTEESRQDEEAAGEDDPIIGKEGGEADTTATWTGRE